MRATIGKSYDLVPLVMSSMFKYDYSSSDTNLARTSSTTFAQSSMANI